MNSDKMNGALKSNQPQNAFASFFSNYRKFMEGTRNVLIVPACNEIWQIVFQYFSNKRDISISPFQSMKAKSARIKDNYYSPRSKNQRTHCMYVDGRTSSGMRRRFACGPRCPTRTKAAACLAGPR